MGLFSNNSIKAAAISESALTLFKKAYEKLEKANAILEHENTQMEIETYELQANIMMNKQQIESNTKVKEQLKSFLPFVTDNGL